VSLLATQQDFEPANPTEGATALYYQPYDGSGYDINAPDFQERCDWLVATYPPTNQKLAIWGCGFGALVNLTVAAGYDAYGFDGSSYAISRGKALLPTIASRLFVRNALVSKDVTASRTDAGLRGQAKFALLVTESMVSTMSDAEISTMLPLLRASSSAAQEVHMEVPEDPGATAAGMNDSRLNWKSSADWKALLSPDVVWDAVNYQVV
jgi:hypothetical protein